MSNMRRLRVEMVNDANAIIQRADSENRAMTDDERTKLTEMRAQIEKLDADIKMREEWDGMAVETRATTQPTKPEPREERGVTWAEAPKPHEVQQAELRYRFGQFLQAVMRSSRPGADMDPLVRDAYEKRAALGMNETVPSDGGFLVGTDFSNELYRRAYTFGELTSRCRRIPISGGSNSTKINGVDETSRATGSRWGGIRGYWLSEAGSPTAGKPKFYQVSLNLQKLGVLAYATDENLADAAQLGTIVMDAAAEEIQWMTENAILNGTGVGMPLGVLNANCLVSTAKETGQAAATLVYQNLIKMWQRRWARSAGNMVWLVNQDVEAQLDQLSFPVGTAGLPPNYITYGTDGVQRIKGRPVIPVEYCQTLGTVGDIVLADFGAYYLADKGGVQAASSIHVQFTTDETVFRFIYRVDGQPMWNSALTPANGTSTVSPFVALATRA